MATFITLNKPNLSVKKQILAVIFACGFAVVLPQFFHLLGKLTGTGSQLASLFSPMHFPVVFVGLIGGPIVGAITGIVAPLANFMLTGMPILAKLPLMIVELFGYGVCAGIMRNLRINNFAKVGITLFFGRFLRFLAVIFLVLVLNKEMSIFSIWLSIPKCLPGIIFQILIIPFIVKKYDSTENLVSNS